MGNAVFIEGERYFGWCSAERLPDQPGWRPVVWFERRSDYGKELVQTVKHTLKVSFAEERRATQEAIRFCDERMKSGEVGL